MPDGTSGPGTSEPGVIGSQLMGGVRAGVVSGGGPLPVPLSKFGCPAVPVRAIARPRLGEVLAQPDWRVALVTGGPATGKTVAVAQWFGTLDPVAREWVTLDAGDDRPERFWLTFVLALDRAVPGAFAQAAAAAADVHRLPPEFLSRLLTAWSAVTDPLVIVLDDVHHLRSPQIAEDLGFVVEHLPGRSRMLLTSRVDPDLPVSRWRGRGWLAEVRQRDLALTLPETAELFTALGEHRLTASDVERLWRRTEGWVAGLRLAAAGLKDRADVSAAVAEFSGRTPVVADLLADELLHRVPEGGVGVLVADVGRRRAGRGAVRRVVGAQRRRGSAPADGGRPAVRDGDGTGPGHLAVSPAAGRDAALRAADAPTGRSATAQSPGRRDPAGAGRRRRRGPLPAGRR